MRQKQYNGMALLGADYLESLREGKEALIKQMVDEMQELMFDEVWPMLHEHCRTMHMKRLGKTSLTDEEELAVKLMADKMLEDSAQKAMDDVYKTFTEPEKPIVKAKVETGTPPKTTPMMDWINKSRAEWDLPPITIEKTEQPTRRRLASVDEKAASILKHSRRELGRTKSIMDLAKEKFESRDSEG